MIETYHPNVCKYCGNDKFTITTTISQKKVKSLDQIDLIQCATCGKLLYE